MFNDSKEGSSYIQLPKKQVIKLAGIAISNMRRYRVRKAKQFIDKIYWKQKKSIFNTIFSHVKHENIKRSITNDNYKELGWNISIPYSNIKYAYFDELQAAKILLKMASFNDPSETLFVSRQDFEVITRSY